MSGKQWPLRVHAEQAHRWQPFVFLSRSSFAVKFCVENKDKNKKDEARPATFFWARLLQQQIRTQHDQPLSKKCSICTRSGGLAGVREEKYVSIELKLVISLSRTIFITAAFWCKRWDKMLVPAKHGTIFDALKRVPKKFGGAATAAISSYRQAY